MRRASLLMTTLLLVFQGTAVAAPASHSASQTAPATRPAFLTGVDANYVPEMEKAGKTWSAEARSAAGGAGTRADPLALLAAAGADAFRVRLWVGDDGPHGLRAATTLARRAKDAGLRPYVVLFLSDGWADMVKQPVPAVWKDLAEPAKLAAVEAYAERAVRAFAAAGVAVDLLEVGNEIDFGVCGEFEEEWPKRVSLEYMSQRVWPRMVPILKAAQAGVRRARPDAKFVLHLAQFADARYCVAFWRSMLAAGVAVDVAGLSYFPTSAAEPSHRLPDFLSKQTAAIRAAVDRPTLVCEYAFPCRRKFGGQFADWDKPAEGYASDEQGQRRWVADFLAAARADPNCAGAVYWSPEWHGPGMWEAFALFDADGVARPALRSLSATPGPQNRSPAAP
ncbi:MAG TPA: glycosyl hydrolase 53 family protein [Humisphaera sp.]